jgi:hypothetical protein
MCSLLTEIHTMFTGPSTASSAPAATRRHALRRGRGAAFAVFALTLATACGDDGDGGTTPPPQPQTGTFTVSVDSATVTSAGLMPATVGIRITRIDGFTGNVTLGADGLPEFVNAGFSPLLLGPGATTSQLTLTPVVRPGITSGEFPFTLTASAARQVPRSVAMQVILANGTLTLVATPASLTIAAGSSGTTTIGITRSDGTANPVSLALFEFPNGFTGTQDPRPATGATATFTIAVAASVAAGQYTVVIRSGAYGTMDATLPIAVTVTR